jgi:hypothetical protein
MLRLKWKEYFFKDYLDADRQNIIEGQGEIILDDSMPTEQMHADIVEKCLEYNPFIIVMTRWGKPRPRCLKCWEVMDQCICEFLADNNFADDEEDK